MNLDVQSLRTFSRLAHSGAEEAAGSLTALTGFDARVAVTKVEMATRSDVEREFRETPVHLSGESRDGAVESFVPVTDDCVERFGSEAKRTICVCPRVFDVTSSSVVSRDIENAPERISSDGIGFLECFLFQK